MSDAETWTTKAVERCEGLIEKAPFFVMFGLDFGLIEFGRWYMETEKGGFDIGRARYYAGYRRGPQREFLARLVTKQLLDEALTEDAHDRLVLDAVEAGYDLGHNELMMHTGSMPIGGKFLGRLLRERLMFLDVYRKAVTKALERLEAKQPAVDELTTVDGGELDGQDCAVLGLGPEHVGQKATVNTSQVEVQIAFSPVQTGERALEAARRRQDTLLSPDERRAIGIDETPAADWMPNPQAAFRPDRIPVPAELMTELGQPKTADELHEKLTQKLMNAGFVERLPVEQARELLRERLTDWVKSKTAADREACGMAWVAFRENFLLTYGRIAWRQSVLWAVETGELDAYIFDKDTLI